MNSTMIRDVHISQADIPWKIFREGIQFKLLRTCSATGTWVALFRHEANTEYLPHKHIGAGEYFIIKGRIELHGGAENGGITAVAGDYGYEPNGIVHEKTYFPELTEHLFINHGPIEILDENGNTARVADWLGITAIWDAAEIVS